MCKMGARSPAGRSGLRHNAVASPPLTPNKRPTPRFYRLCGFRAPDRSARRQQRTPPEAQITTHARHPPWAPLMEQNHRPDGHRAGQPPDLKPAWVADWGPTLASNPPPNPALIRARAKFNGISSRLGPDWRLPGKPASPATDNAYSMQGLLHGFWHLLHATHTRALKLNHRPNGRPTKTLREGGTTATATLNYNNYNTAGACLLREMLLHAV